MSKGLGAVMFGAVIVGGAAIWNTLKRREDAAKEPEFIYVQQPAQDSGNDGWKNGLLNFGINSLFGAIGGAQVDPNTSPGQPGTGGTAGGGGWVGDLLGGWGLGQPVTGGDDFGGGTTGTGGTGGLLDFLGRHESRGDYNAVYNGNPNPPPRPITSMTVGEVMKYQRESVNKGSASSAVGKYQTLERTLGDAVQNGVVSLDEPYDPEAQDRVGNFLLERRGLSDYRSGRISQTTFAQNLSKEWASLPAFTRDRSGRAAQGQSYYAGDGLNAALTSKDAVLNAIKGL